ncbi:hypothetical protein ABZ446_28440 [Streptomyces sp. NPDC005813]|uniref:hypothetical protein n=1 Tax=Streptomyces sp. NPDC005813 TaxID=3155592 RepID=UPI0033D9C889
MPVDVSNLPTLQLGDIEDESSAMLRARGVAYIREFARISGAQTVLKKNIATVVLAIRKKHDDWLGRTQPYRQEVAEMYREANIPPDSMDNIQASVRYHIGNQLREVLPDDELRALELKSDGPLARSQNQRSTNAALLSASKLSAEASAPVSKGMQKTKPKSGKSSKVSERVPEQGSDIKATADHLRLSHAARQLVEQLSPDVIADHMTDGQRAKLDEELAAIQEAVAKLRRRTRKRRSDD